MDSDVLDRLLRESQTGGDIQSATLKEVLDRDREELRRLAQALPGDEKTGAPTPPGPRAWPMLLKPTGPLSAGWPSRPGAALL